MEETIVKQGIRQAKELHALMDKYPLKTEVEESMASAIKELSKAYILLAQDHIKFLNIQKWN